MSQISSMLDIQFEQPFNIVYPNGKKEPQPYVMRETGLFTQTGRPTPYVLINILTGRAGIIKE